jgi:uncharacterized protein (DUF433 family)
MSGTRIFAGTRVLFKILINHLTSGETPDQFPDDCPTVEREQAEGYLGMTLPDAQAHRAEITDV